MFLKYVLKLKDISLDKFIKFKSCDIYFDTLYRQLGIDDINIKDKSFNSKKIVRIIYQLILVSLYFHISLKIFKK